ncbi:MAG: substrate-binding domain-containing protein [Planctomycetaceae bacterium]|nr:substrate-binding domain-containing protein [Planctomycetaceae bacterium]
MKTSSLVLLLCLPVLVVASPTQRFPMGLPAEQPGVLSEVTPENREQWGFHRCLDLGVIPTDPAQWDEEFQAVFFGNMPPEYHQKYIEAFAKLRTANGAYWKVRAELFEILHPHLDLSGLERELERRNESRESVLKSYETDLTRDDLPDSILRARVLHYNRTLDQYRVCRAMFDGDYRPVAVEQTREYEKRYLTANSNVFKEYPEWLDPDKQTEYWEALTEEIIFRCGTMTEVFLTQTKEIKERIDEVDKSPNAESDQSPDEVGISCDLYDSSAADYSSSAYGNSSDTGGFHIATVPSWQQRITNLIRNYTSSSSGAMSFEWSYFPPISLNDKQKLRLANDEPLFLSRSLENISPSFWDCAALRELRDAELEQWKIEAAQQVDDRANPPRLFGLFSLPSPPPTATPELVNLGLYQAQVARWDGSLSLHPLIRDIAKRIRGIDMRTLNTSVEIGVARSMGSGRMIGAGRGPVERTLSLPQLDMSDEEARENTPPVAHPALRALLRGEKDIVFSVQLSQADIDAVQVAEVGDEKVELVIVPFAKDALVFLQNRHNPVRGLTLEQYREIISGEHTYWTEVGGFGGEIQTVFRYENPESVGLMPTLLSLDASVYEDFKSRSYDALTGKLPGKVGGPSVYVDSTPGGFAFTSYQYDRYMALSTATRTMSVDSVFPNAETIASGKYPLVYDCVLVHRKDPGKEVEQFVQWLLSEEGQKLVRSVGYVPVMYTATHQ